MNHTDRDALRDDDAARPVLREAEIHEINRYKTQHLIIYNLTRVCLSVHPLKWGRAPPPSVRLDGAPTVVV